MVLNGKYGKFLCFSIIHQRFFHFRSLIFPFAFPPRRVYTKKFSN